ncbi:MAG: RdgB/HAM1 family non-canonical purine NTP pyrophosphatase [Lachnospiraceae bacterium]|nr:RdgB/HAM1 family non-canonical purine NTP pyrophosphatase [Lachnospiraceae bacterium]
MKRIVFATNNAGKAREVRRILKDTDAEVFVLKDIKLTSDPVENGATFAENARIKALDVYNRLKEKDDLENTIVMADDSGLTIDCLNGAPGVHSARFMGHDTSYELKNRAILELMEFVPEEKRGAAFVCHICAINEDGRIFDEEAEFRGAIAYEPDGNGGFGYDPIFWLPELGCTSGSLTEDEKNSISHRGKVLRKIKETLCQNQLL